MEIPENLKGHFYQLKSDFYFLISKNKSRNSQQETRAQFFEGSTRYQLQFYK